MDLLLKSEDFDKNSEAFINIFYHNIGTLKTVRSDENLPKNINNRANTYFLS